MREILKRLIADVANNQIPNGEAATRAATEAKAFFAKEQENADQVQSAQAEAPQASLPGEAVAPSAPQDGAGDAAKRAATVPTGGTKRNNSALRT